MTDELIGKKIGGYEITGLIGRGGMAAVYRAHQVSMNRTVALKILPRHFLNHEDYLQRFHREVKIVSQLEHRNIVPVHDYGEHEGQPFIAMRYMPGGSVDDVLQKGALSVEQLISVLEQIAPALDYAHAKNVLHRDLKPSNVLMDDDDGAYLTDFGIARILSESGGTITTQGVVGTPSYMSPEQAQGLPLDNRSDIYALGVMIFEMATGRRPFESDTPYGIAVMQVTTPPPAPRSFNPQLSPAVEAVILTALKKRREERYDSAMQLVDAFKRALHEPAISVTDTQPGMPKPDYVPPAPPSPPPMEYVPQYTPMPAPSQPPVSRVESAAVPRVRRKRGGSNLWLSALIGSVIGCGLLALLVLVAAIIINNTRREEAELIQTATADGALTLTATFVLGEGDAGGVLPEVTAEASAQAAETPFATARLTERIVTHTPIPAVPALTPAPPMPTNTPIPRTPTETPFTGVAPIGVRPSETPAPQINIDGNLLFFAERGGSYDVYRMRLPSRAETQLTDDALSDTYPMISPDGEWIVFQSDRDGDFDIYVMESGGINTRRIVQNRVTDRIPSWSPDSAWILFSSDTRGDGNFDLFRVRPDGSDLELLYSNGQRNSHARWSPDNRYIAFTSGRADDAAIWDIARYDLETGEVIFLTDNNAKDWSPTFNADGSRILYLTQGRGFGAIAEMDIDGENSRIVYDGPGYESEANYVADDRYIVFTSDVSGHDELYLMTADGEDIQPLTTRGGHYGTWAAQ